MDTFVFFSSFDCEKNKDYLRVEVPSNIEDRYELFSFYNSKLFHMERMGKNWDAFRDCMTSLYGVKYKYIWILHTDIPFSENIKDRKNYIELLQEAVLSWREPLRARSIGHGYYNHVMIVDFPAAYKGIVEDIVFSL